MKKKEHIRQAQLPRGAYAKSLDEIIDYFRKKAEANRLREQKEKADSV